MYEIYFSFLGTFRSPKKDPKEQCWDGEKYHLPVIPKGWNYSQKQTARFAKILAVMSGIDIQVWAKQKCNYYLLVTSFGSQFEAAFVYPPKQHHKNSCCSQQPHGSYLREW